MFIPKERLLRVLDSFNPWWTTGMIHPGYTKTFHKTAFDEISYIVRPEERGGGKERGILLAGGRGLGKTTMIYQLAEMGVKNGINPKAILYVPMEHTVLKLAGVDEALSCYHENVYPGGDAYYFLDEIEYEPDWEIWLDTIGDLRPDAKIVAASSAFCGKKRRNKEANESIKTIEISALSFFEYCRLTGVDVPDISDIASDLKFSHMTKHRMIELINSIAPVQNHFSRYLQRGGFPETSLAADQFSSQIIREKVVNKSIKEDILSISSVRNPTELEKIFLYLCGVTSEIVSIEAIAKNVESVSRPTVESYIEYIEDAGLIYMSDPIEIPPYKIQKSSPKIYIADAAIRSAILMGEPIGLVGDEARRLVEGAVYRAVRGSRRAGSIAGYLRGDHRGRSIDIAARHGDEYTLIDVRFDEEGTGPGDGIIYELAPAAGEAVVVTKNAGDFGLKKSPDGRMIAFIPAYAFLYLTGATRKLF